MTDIKVAEEIGLKLQERKRANQTEEVAVTSSPERTSEEIPQDFETWDNDNFRDRVHEILLSGRMLDVDIDKIQIPAVGLAKFQFRRHRESDALKQSILANGVLEPIVLQVLGEMFFVIDGHTRLKLWIEATAEDATLPKPAFLVLDVPDPIAMQLAYALNNYGQNLNSEDNDVLIIRLFEQGRMKQVDIAKLRGLSKGYVSEVISGFRDVPPEARALLESGGWTVKHGRELARLKEHPDVQRRIMKQAIATKYDSAMMEEKVDNALAKQKWIKQAEKKLEKANIEGRIEGEEVKVLTTGQVEAIHKDLMKDTTQRRPAYSGDDHQVVFVGRGEYEPTPAATVKVLKSLGYEVVPGEAPAKPEAPAERPKMPSAEELMNEDAYYRSICPFCKGRTHPTIAEEMGFKTKRTYQMGNGGIAHVRCWIQADIDDKKKQINKLENELAKDDLTLLIEAGETLDQINNRSHDLYKKELEARKDAWREKNLPKKTITKGRHVGEPLPEKRKNFGSLVEKVRKKSPKMVPNTPDYWEAYVKYKQEEEGYGSLPQVAKSLGLKSHGSVLKQFQKLDKAVAEEVSN